MQDTCWQYLLRDGFCCYSATFGPGNASQRCLLLSTHWRRRGASRLPFFNTPLERPSLIFKPYMLFDHSHGARFKDSTEDPILSSLWSTVILPDKKPHPRQNLYPCSLGQVLNPYNPLYGFIITIWFLVFCCIPHRNFTSL